jgi:MFS family permease
MKKTLFFTNRNFALLFLGGLVSRLGDSFYNFAISWYILSLTGSPVQAGYYMAFGAVIYLILSPFGGAIVDRLDKIKVIYLTDFVRGISVLVAGLMIFSGVEQSTQLIILYITSFIISIMGALFNPASSSVIPYLVDENELQEANSYNQMLNSFVGIIGIILGGTLFGLLGVGWIFIINAVSYILSGFSEMFIKARTQEKATGPMNIDSIFKDMYEGFLYLKEKNAMMTVGILAVFINFFISPMFSNGLPYIFNQVLKTDPLYLAIVNISFMVGTIVMALVLSQKKQKDKVSKDLKFGMALWVPLIALTTLNVYAVINNYIPVTLFVLFSVLIFVLIGALSSYVNIPLSVIMHKYVDKEMLGRVGSLIGTLSQGLIPVALIIGGYIIENFGIVNLYVYSFLGFLVTVVILTFNQAINDL